MNQEFWVFRQLLDSIPNINRGGCAYAALAMYKLGKRLGMNVHIMYLYYCKEDYHINSLALDRVDEPCECLHAVVTVDNDAYDSHKWVPVSIYTYRHFVPEELVIRSLRVGRWNDEFDKGRYVPEIESVLGEQLLT